MSERGKIALQCLEVGRNHRTCGGMDAAIKKIEELQATAISDVDIIKRQTKRIVALRKKVGELEAKIDSLMFEYCPDEMTEEQKRVWGENQVEAENE